ncbi:hypothetical protein GGI12_005768 [Dipsacomyces acuminosporus]|nr:hypothetical protein GGI12_005768 [Dipsacomyces acuminosporus]
MSSSNVVIVTGASRGIGKAIALSLIKRGVSVIGLARSADALNAVAQEASQVAGSSSVKFTPVAGDVTDDAVQQSAVDMAAKQGTLVALVNNAAIVDPICPIASADFDAWTRHIQINFVTPFKLIQKVLPQLRSVKGRVINLSSSGSKDIHLHTAVYGASKSAINYATAVLAAEEPEITAIAIHPGAVDTGLLGSFIEDLGRNESEANKVKLEAIAGIKMSTELPGAIIAGLALKADHSLSGKYAEYDQPEIAAYAQ